LEDRACAAFAPRSSCFHGPSSDFGPEAFGGDCSLRTEIVSKSPIRAELEMSVPAPVTSEEVPAARLLAGPVDLVSYVVIFVVVTFSLIYFCDRDGYEGDDLSVLSAVFQLDAAKHGDLEIYRYGWQPLSYEVLALVYRVFDTPQAVFLTPPVCVAATLTILLSALSYRGRRLRSVWVHAALLGLLPELLYSGLYLNTTALAMPAAAVAIWIMATSGTVVGPWRSFAIAALLAVAVLFRFDFLLMIPLIGALLWVHDRSKGTPLAFVAGGATVLAAFVLLGLIRPFELIDTVLDHHKEMNFGQHSVFKWTWRDNVRVIAVTMHPVAWAIALAGLPGLLADYRRRHGLGALVFVAVVSQPLFYPLTSLASVKYLVPLLLLLPFVMLAALERLCASWGQTGVKLLSLGVVAAAAGAWLVSIEPSKKLPFIRATVFEPKDLHTCDGKRTLGAYLVALGTPGSAAFGRYGRQAAHRIVEALDAGEAHEIWFVGTDSTWSPGAVGWRYVRTLLARRGLHGTCVAPKTIQYQLENGARITMTTPDSQASAPSGATQIDLSDAELRSENLLSVVDASLAASAAGTAPK
jgi:hypothetical protein